MRVVYRFVEGNTPLELAILLLNEFGLKSETNIYAHTFKMVAGEEILQVHTSKLGHARNYLASISLELGHFALLIWA